ncbi:hypothetical protein F2Q70_00014987 [Brassica cretica]|uniref:Uncharacterized protein n=3 Tax=Brassica TaxID=3705 RepID=A0A3N6TAM7_BRACR|nr:hypothetical protein F2Q70_00014987 [Brassica cretica]
MSLFLSRLSRLRLVKPALVRRSSSVSLLISNGFSTTSLRQTPPCSVIGARPCGDDLGGLIVAYADTHAWTELDKMVRLELVCNSINHGKTLTIGASHGWVASLKEDGTLCLQDDLNP